MEMLNTQTVFECKSQDVSEGTQLRTLHDLELALIGGGSGDVIFA